MPISLATAVIAAAGGSRWSEVERIDLTRTLGGAVWGLKRATGTVEHGLTHVDVRRQRTRIDSFGPTGGFAEYTPDRVTITTGRPGESEVLDHPREVVRRARCRHPLVTSTGRLLCRVHDVDVHDRGLVAPAPGVDTEEDGTWTEAGTSLRRLRVSYPSSITTHSRVQTLYVDGDDLVRRRDYEADVMGGGPELRSSSPATPRWTGSSSQRRETCSPGPRGWDRRRPAPGVHPTRRRRGGVTREEGRATSGRGRPGTLRPASPSSLRRCDRAAPRTSVLKSVVEVARARNSATTIVDIRTKEAGVTARHPRRTATLRSPAPWANAVRTARSSDRATSEPKPVVTHPPAQSSRLLCSDKYPRTSSASAARWSTASPRGLRGPCSSARTRSRWPRRRARPSTGSAGRTRVGEPDLAHHVADTHGRGAPLPEHV